MRFFLNHRKHDGLVRDPEGSERPNQAAATMEANDAARELMATAVRRGLDISDDTCEIVDERQRLLARIMFKMALRRPGN